MHGESREVGAIIGVHCHNEFGLATAISLAAVRAGAQLLDVSVNGLGDRSGNTPAEELAAALELLCERKTGINLPGMTELSQYMDKISGIRTPDTKPLVGKYVFSHELDQHISAQLENPLTFQCIQAEAAGNKTEIIFGKFSGENSIEWKVREAGVQIEKERYPEILRILSEEEQKNKGTVARDREFWNTVEKAQESAE